MQQTLSEPPETTVPGVELISFNLGRFPTYLAALEEANRQLAKAGVDQARIEAMDRRLRETRAPHPSYPLEGCAYAAANLLKVREETHLSIDIGLSSPGTWKVFGDWPDTCRADAGP